MDLVDPFDSVDLVDQGEMLLGDLHARLNELEESVKGIRQVRS